MKIWIDCDGCPKDVRQIVFKAALKRNVPTVVVANAYIKLPVNPLIQMQVVPGNFDAADNHIADHVNQGDLVITSDIPLADRVVIIGALVVTNRGEEIDSSNSKDRLSSRNLMAELRSAGEVQGGPPPLGPKDLQKFAAAFDRTLTKLLGQKRTS